VVPSEFKNIFIRLSSISTLSASPFINAAALACTSVSNFIIILVGAFGA
jgi:hypothetical protein